MPDNLWESFKDELRDLWESGDDDELVQDILHDMVADKDTEALKDAIYEMTSDRAERHALYSAAFEAGYE